MASETLKRFCNRLRTLDAREKRRFLHGVYKQLVPSQNGRLAKGEYRRAIAAMGEEDRRALVASVADALKDHQFHRHAQKLLEYDDGLQYFALFIQSAHPEEAYWAQDREKLMRGYGRWHSTLSRLEHLDPNWRTWIAPDPRYVGIQLDAADFDFGGFRSGNPFSASIVLHDGSYGKEDGTYEILPRFDGKELPGGVLGWLPLEKAVAIAHAVLQRDEAKFQHAVATAYETERR